MADAITHRHRQTETYTYNDAGSTILLRLDKNLTHRKTDRHTERQGSW